MLLSEVTKILKKDRKNLGEQGVLELSIFGSLVRSEQKKKSDVDILIEFDSKKGLFAFVGLKQYLEAKLGCPVDLVTKDALHPALKRRILKEAKNVF